MESSFLPGGLLHKPFYNALLSNGTISAESANKLKRLAEKSYGLRKKSLYNAKSHEYEAFMKALKAEIHRRRAEIHRRQAGSSSSSSNSSSNSNSNNNSNTSSRRRQTVYVMVGPTGAGKTTYAEKLARNTGAVIVSSDVYKSDRKKIDKVVMNALRNNKNVIVDATHPTAERRQSIADLARGVGASTRCIHVNVERSIAASRSKLPGVTKYQVAAMHFKRFEPLGSECDSVVRVGNDEEYSLSIATQGPSTAARPRPPATASARPAAATAAVSPGTIKAMKALDYNASKHKGPYYASEKLDGIRALFHGGELYSQKGLRLAAPQWFLDAIPRGTFDGELFLGRGKFSDAMKVVMKSTPVNSEWKRVQYRIFDDYLSKNSFSTTHRRLQSLLPECTADGPPVCLQRQTLVETPRNIQRMFDEVIGARGEGLMLRENKPYAPGPTKTTRILKVKKMKDAEATIVGFNYDPKDPGRIQSLRCSWTMEGVKVQFSVGSGLKAKDRTSGKFRIGDLVTVQYFELTETKKPRFPVFKAVRHPGT